MAVVIDSVSLDQPSQKQPVKIDFLSSYYQQDGDNSAVEGGQGDEALKDGGNVIKIFIPLKNNKSLLLDNGISFFSSASTDNIDPRTISAASSHDIKISANATVTKTNKQTESDYSISIGASHEAHFASVNAGLGWVKKMSQFPGDWSFKMAFTMDVWGQYYDISRLYPSDYNSFINEDLTSNKRYTLQTGLSYQHVFHPRLKGSLAVDVIHQFGLLSTPYHRVIFQDIDIAMLDIERLPDYRLRLPITGRLNWHASDWLKLRSSYRFYWDNFGLKAHSIYLELPVKPHRFLSIYPFYRFHQQQGNKYFAPLGQHISTETYYTSDYDVSDLTSHYMGGGIRWTPFFKNKTKSKERFLIQSVELRGGYFTREDGLEAWIISGGFSFNITRKD